MSTSLTSIILAFVAVTAGWLVALNVRVLSRSGFGRRTALPPIKHSLTGRIAGVGLVLVAVASANAHFVFLVPLPEDKRVAVILSEDLHPDDQIDAGLVRSSKLTCRDGQGKEMPLRIAMEHGSCFADLPAVSPRVLHGSTDLGVQQRGNAKPFLLIYYPKTIVGGNPFDPSTALGDSAPVEILCVGKPKEVRFRVTAGGKALAAAPLTVIFPDGTQKKLVTDAAGESPPFDQVGTYGVWTRAIEPVGGQRDGKHYDEVRRYATLVVQIVP